MLALPAVTAPAGFAPSAAALLGCWLYMVMTGLLVAEVNLSLLCAVGNGSGTGLISMVKRTLGGGGTALAWGTYVFLHYALLVAYIARAGETVGEAAGVGASVGAVAFTAGMGGLCYFSPTKVLDGVNAILFAGVLGSFGVLLVAAAGRVEDLSSLARADWGELPDALPVVALAFVYQNVVPTIVSQLEGDRSKIRTAIVGGTAVPLVMFLLWEAAALGATANTSAADDLAGVESAVVDPLRMLAADGLGDVVSVFSLLAVSTSYIGFVLGLSDFLADGLNLPSGDGGKQPLSYTLTLAPPLAFALVKPDAFFGALDLAGTFGVLTLFGVMPAAMAYSERYMGNAGIGDDKSKTLARAAELVPGGAPGLVALGGVAAAIIAIEGSKKLIGG